MAQRGYPNEEGITMYVECHMPSDCGLLSGEEFEVLAEYPAGAEFDPVHYPGSLWTCPAYRVRDVFDNKEYVAPRSWFTRIADRPAGYQR